jgi:hypothetical protein
LTKFKFTALDGRKICVNMSKHGAAIQKTKRKNVNGNEDGRPWNRYTIHCEYVDDFGDYADVSARTFRRIFNKLSGRLVVYGNDNEIEYCGKTIEYMDCNTWWGLPEAK